MGKCPLFVYSSVIRKGKELEGGVRENVFGATRGVIHGLGFELVDVEATRQGEKLFIRILIDREGGVTVGDCAMASGLVGKVMERDDIVEGSYVLEVMSPGVNRRLRRPEDFSVSTGKRIKVKLYQPFEGNRSYSGILMNAGGDSFELELGHELLELKYESVSMVTLDPELPW